METKKTHSWKTTSGLEVTATCELVLSEKVYADGWNVETSCTKKRFEISVAGMGVVGTYINRRPVTANGIKYAATCGKLAISQENLDAIDKMVAEIESHPAWIAKMEALKAAAKADAEYDAHYASVTNAMAK